MHDQSKVKYFVVYIHALNLLALETFGCRATTLCLSSWLNYNLILAPILDVIHDLAIMRSTITVSGKSRYLTKIKKRH